MKAFGLNALGRGFDLEDLDIAAPMEREDLVNVQTLGCVAPPAFHSSQS
jgi:hypothetical protein